MMEGWYGWRGHGISMTPSPTPCSMLIFHLAVPKLYPLQMFYNEPVNTKYFLSSVSYSIKLLTLRRRWWDPVIYSQLHRSIKRPQTSNWHLKWGAVL